MWKTSSDFTGTYQGEIDSVIDPKNKIDPDNAY